MRDNSPSPVLRFLLAAACVVIILAGIRATAAILAPLLLGLLLAYAVVPFPQWLMRRFKLTKRTAIVLTAVAAGSAAIYLVFAVDLATVRVAAKLPLYEEHLVLLYERVANFASDHGFQAPILSVRNVLNPARLKEITRVLLPEAGVVISNGLLVTLLAFLFMMEMAEDIGVKLNPLAETLAYYASNAQSYVTVTAKTAGINALLNLAFLLLMRVDTPVVWCFVYFFLDFIPTLGFIVALIPPTFVTLLMYGWKRALLVACGLIVTNVIVDNVVTPIFMKHAVDISFLEITLSLVLWAFLLGLTGAILAIPLTLSLKKIIAKNVSEPEVALAPSG
jgi:AI-2 transport protein TqsA